MARSVLFARSWVSGSMAASLGLALVLPYAAFAHVPWRQHVARLIVPPLEQRFADAANRVDLAAVTGLVVVGGSDGRLREAGRLARQWRHLRVFVSGAGPEDVVWRLLGDGIEPGRVTIENLSRKTFENAVNSRRLLAPAPHERWLLVTSAVHMPRTTGAFRRVGFPTEPWPVHDLPQSPEGALEQARHEWLGLAWYWMLARVDTPFPGPAPTTAHQRGAGGGIVPAASPRE